MKIRTTWTRIYLHRKTGPISRRKENLGECHRLHTNTGISHQAHSSHWLEVGSVSEKVDRSHCVCHADNENIVLNCHQGGSHKVIRKVPFGTWWVFSRITLNWYIRSKTAFGLLPSTPTGTTINLNWGRAGTLSPMTGISGLNKRQTQAILGYSDNNVTSPLT